MESVASVDIYADCGGYKMFNPWNQRSSPCPGSEGAPISDYPGILEGYKDANGIFTSVGNNHRKLDFTITVESGDPFFCERDSASASATQTIDIKGGVVTKTFVAH